MIRWTAFLLLLVSFQVSAQDKQFVLDGTITNASVKILYLRYVDYSGKDVLDSAQIQKSAFSFKGKINQPTRAIFKTSRKPVSDIDPNFIAFYLEPKNVKVQVVYNHFKDINVSGSKTQSEANLLVNQVTPFSNECKILSDSLAQLTQHNSKGISQEILQSKTDRINQQIQKAAGNIQSAAYQFIKNHPNSWVSTYELASYRNHWPIDSVQYLFNRLSPELQKSLEGQKVADKIALVEQAKSSIGLPACRFSTTDLTGQSISLTDFKGRYVLLDFWGSWCVPCRAGNPHLLDLYEKYKEKGIEFVGIACSDTPEAWRKAIEKDRIGVWRHISDTELKVDNVRGQDKSISKQYAIDSYPTKILIDPKGFIIGRYQWGDEQQMDEKFKKLFN